LFLLGLEFELWAYHLQAGALPLEPHLQSIFALIIFLEMGSPKLLAWAGLELPSS
jgi:hypothetical protein